MAIGKIVKKTQGLFFYWHIDAQLVLITTLTNNLFTLIVKCYNCVSYWSFPEFLPKYPNGIFFWLFGAIVMQHIKLSFSIC